mgnify:CR=1 FL=1
MDKFDEDDSVYGTKMAGLLKKIQEKGIKTSIDVVSDNSADYGKKVIPALKYSNYVIINEIECCRIFNLEAYDKNGKLDRKNIKFAMESMVKAGVKDKVIIHCKETAFALDVKTNEFIEVPSLKIKKEMIKGSVGAGDTFCAGSLYGIYHGLTDEETLKFASALKTNSFQLRNNQLYLRPQHLYFLQVWQYMLPKQLHHCRIGHSLLYLVYECASPIYAILNL